MELLQNLWQTGDTRKVTEGVLGAENIWKSDLNQIPGLTDMVQDFIDRILSKGMLEAVKTIL